MGGHFTTFRSSLTATRRPLRLPCPATQRLGQTMARKLRWVAFVAFLTFPLILYLGRPRTCVSGSGVLQCDPPIAEYPSWTAPASFSVIAIGVLLLLAAALMSLSRNDESN
jgi:hypothetical protein